jgi:hypothetical protein
MEGPLLSEKWSVAAIASLVFAIAVLVLVVAAVLVALFVFHIQDFRPWG